MACPKKQLEDQLMEVGNRLASPPADVEELLDLLDQTETFLSRVEQSPPKSMSEALDPAIKALVAKELFRHPDMDVQVSVASCISEITRITAPQTPYNDDLMKEVFQKIVEAFKILDNTSSRSYQKRVSILETVAKVRSCVVMLDLECDTLIIEMFHHFLKTIGSNNSERVFSSMETIMTLVLEESEDVPSGLLLCLLASVKRNSEDILPPTRKLAEKVMTNCGTKLKPYLMEVVGSMGAPLSDYDKFVSTICEGSSQALDQGDVSREVEDSKLSDRTVSDGLPWRSEMAEPEVCYPTEDGAAVDKSKTLVTSNGTVRRKNTDCMAEPTTRDQKPDNLDSDEGRRDEISDDNTKKTEGQKISPAVQVIDRSAFSKKDGDEEVLVPSKRKGRRKESRSLPSDGPSGQGAETSTSLDLAKRHLRERPLQSEKGAGQIASTETSPGAARPRRGRPPSSRTGAKKGIGATQTDGQKNDLGNDGTSEEMVPPKDTDAKMDAENADDSEEKLQRPLDRSVLSESADDGTPTKEIPSKKDGSAETETGMEHLKRSGRKGTSRKSTHSESSGKLKSHTKNVRDKASAENAASGELSLKEMVSSSKPANKLPSKDQSHLDEGSKTKARRKRALGMDEPLETKNHGEDQGEELVGSRIEVWWPDDKKFYAGVVQSFDPVEKKHMVVYDDGDVEVLIFKDEKWHLIEGGAAKNVDHDKEMLGSDASLEGRRNKKAKRGSDSVSKEAKQDVPDKGGKSQSAGRDSSSNRVGDAPKPRGRPKGSSSNVSTPKTSGRPKGKLVRKSRGYVDSEAAKLKEETDIKPQDDRSETDSDATPLASSKLKEKTPEVSSKSKDDTLKASAKATEASSKTVGKLKNETAASARKWKNDKVTTDSKADVDDRKVNEGTPKPGRKRKQSVTPATGKSDNDANGKRKLVKEIESLDVKPSSNMEKVKESAMASGKKRRRKGRR